VFRTIHTIKGTCGFLGFNKLEKVAHAGENLLSRLRDGQMVRAGQYWMLEKLKSFDEFLERRFPESGV